jgi:hypothetical protein
VTSWQACVAHARARAGIAQVRCVTSCWWLVGVSANALVAIDANIWLKISLTNGAHCITDDT